MGAPQAVPDPLPTGGAAWAWLSGLLEGLPDLLLILDDHGRVTFASAASRPILGLPPEALQGRTWAEAGLPNSAVQALERAISLARSAERPEPMTLRLTLPTGTVDLEGTFAHLPSAAGSGGGMAALLRDISAWKGPEMEDPPTTALLASAFHMLPDALAFTRLADGKIVEVNESFLRLTGFERHEVVGATTLGLGIWSDPTVRGEILRRLQAHGEVQGVFTRIIRKDGGLRDVVMGGTLVQFRGEACLFSMATDVTEELRAKEALERERESLRRIIHLNPYAIQILDAEGRHRDHNPAFLEVFGSFPPPTWCIFEDPVLAQQGMLPRLEPLRRGEVVTLPALWYDPHDTLPEAPSRRVCVRTTAFPLLEADGAIGSYVLMLEDITEWHQAEQALRRSEAQARNLFQTMAQGVIYQDAKGWILTANPAAERILGLSLDAMRDRDSLDPRWRCLREDGSPFPGEDHPAMVALRTGRPVEGVVMGFPRPPEGQIRWVVVSSQPEFEVEATGPVRVFTTLTDITELKGAQDALGANARRLQGVLDGSASVVFQLDAQGRFLLSEGRGLTALGLRSGQVVGLSAFDLYREYPETVAMLRTALEGQPAHSLLHVAGLWFDTVLTPILDAQGQVESVVGVSTDVSALVETQETLRLSQARLEEALKAGKAGIWEVRPDGTGFRTLGLENILPPSDQGLPDSLEAWVARFHPGDREALAFALQATLAGRSPQLHLEVRLPRPPGPPAWVAVRGHLHGGDSAGEGHLLGTLTDIADLKETERALRESEAHHRALLEALPDLMFLTHRDGTFLDYHASEPRKLLLPPEQFMGRTVMDIFPPGLAETFMQAYRRALDSREVQYLEYELPTPEGLCQFEARIVRSGPDTAISIVRDITPLKQAESALRQREAQFRALADHTTDHLFWLETLEDGGFRIEGVNHALATAFGARPGDLAGKLLADLLPAEQLGPMLARYRQCLGQAAPLTYEEEALLPVGGRRCFETLLVPLRDEDGRFRRLVGTSRDITEAKHSEEALRQAQKLESLGVLAGGIAHDFNNLLTAILGNLNLAQLHLPEQAPALPYLHNAEKTVLRAADLTKQMLAYSGRGQVVVAPQSLNGVVQDLTNLLQVTLPKKVALKFDLAPDLPAVEADAAQLQQVVMNLVTNAAESIGEAEGVIAIASRAEVLGPRDLTGTFPGGTLRPGPHVVLEVRDTGCGIAPEAMERIFDPFFSTKASGRGLGLSAMVGILRSHHAALRLHSVVGRGTTFTLCFPTCKDAAAPPSPPAASASATPFQGLVLLADDEPMVREFAQGALELLGFQVVPTPDGQAAVEAFRERPGAFRLAFLDLMMPRMNGHEACRALRGLRPDLPVVLCSGYSPQEVLGELVKDPCVRFLQKPYQVSELRKTLAALLAPGAP